MMNCKEIKNIFSGIRKLNLSLKEKKRMLRLIQIKGSNKKNKVVTYNQLVKMINLNKGKINHAVLGPKWNRLVFVDVNFEV